MLSVVVMYICDVCLIVGGGGGKCDIWKPGERGMSCDMAQPEFGVLQGTSFHECSTAGMFFTPIMILCFNVLWHC